MKMKITKAVAVIAAVAVCIGVLLCIAGKSGRGSLVRAFENMGGKVYYYDDRDKNNHEQEFEEFYDEFFNDDLEHFFDEFEDIYGGESNEASL